MILTKTPFRMSFVGGGSDLPVFYRESEGAVISSTIDKYVYVAVNRKFDTRVRLSYSKIQLQIYLQKAPGWGLRVHLLLACLMPCIV